MTVQTSTSTASFAGNGVTSVFPIGFKFNSAADLIVSLIEDTTGGILPLILNSQYTVSGAGDESGGTVTLITPPAEGQTLKVKRVIEILQLTDLRNQGKFFAESHEDALDRLTMIDQQQQEAIDVATALSQSVADTAAEMVTRQDAFELSAGYYDLGDYSAGLAVTARNQVFLKDGEYYRPSAGLAMPYTLTGVWAADSAYFVGVGDAVLRQELASASDSAKGAGLIGYAGSTVSKKLDELDAGIDNVLSFGAVGDGVADDTAAVIAARDSAVSNGRILYFPSGTYALGALDLGFSGLKVHCEPTTTLAHTGVGRFITFDAGTGLEGYFYDIHLTGYPTLQGNINTTDLIYIRSSHHMLIDARARDCDCAVRVDFSVLSRIFINHSVNQAPFSIKTPVNTLVLDKRNRVDAAVEPTTACDVWVVSEGVSGAGLLFEYAQVNHVLGGTSEGNGIGIDVKPNSSGNRFDAVFMEANSVKDISDASSYTEYNNCYAGSAVGSIVGSGYKRRFVGGYIKSLVIDSPAGFTRLVDVNLPGSFADNSINTIRDGCHALGSAISDRPNGLWKAHKGGGDQGGISSAVWTKVTFGSEVEDSLGIYDAVNSRVVPAAGCYEFTATVSIKAGVVDSGIYGVAIFKNGARIAEMLQHASGTNQISITVTCQDRTDGSGVYEVYAYGNGAGLKTIGGHPAESWFCGKFLLQ